jgi:hypothetical protein
MGASHWENSAYCWVVICKNKKVHRAVNLNAGHKIPLAETDAFAPAPTIDGSFVSRRKYTVDDRHFCF